MANHAHTTKRPASLKTARRRCSRDKPLTPEIAATIDFEAMTGLTPIMPASQFMQQSLDAYNVLVISGGILTKSPADLTAAFRTDGDEPNENLILETIGAVTSTKEWFEGFAKVLGCVESRLLIAVSRLVQEQAP